MALYPHLPEFLLKRPLRLQHIVQPCQLFPPLRVPRLYFCLSVKRSRGQVFDTCLDGIDDGIPGTCLYGLEFLVGECEKRR